MPRYIDVDEFVKRVIQYPRQSTKTIGLALANTPTADVVEVVRCKDCKYHEDEVPGMVWCPHIVGNWVNDNWFCAEGERKEMNE